MLLNYNKWLKNLQAQGLLAIPTGDYILRFLPPLTITKDEIDLALGKIQKVLG